MICRVRFSICSQQSKRRRRDSRLRCSEARSFSVNLSGLVLSLLMSKRKKRLQLRLRVQESESLSILRGL